MIHHLAAALGLAFIATTAAIEGSVLLDESAYARRKPLLYATSIAALYALTLVGSVTSIHQAWEALS